jgi:hypothetical protein
MGDFDFRSKFDRLFPPVVSIIILVIAIIERNSIVAVLAVILYFVIIASEMLVKMHDELRMNNNIMLELLDIVEEDYDEDEDGEEDRPDDSPDGKPFETTKQAPSPKAKPKIVLDEADEATWAALLKKLKNKDDK